MSITVTTDGLDDTDECMACKRQHGCDGDRAELRLVADPENHDREGAQLVLCPAHALRMWNALGAMLMMREPALIKCVRTGAAEMTKAGKALL